MFRCDVCDSVTPPRTPCNRITGLTRAIDYPRRDKVHWHPPNDGGKGKWVDDPGGLGTAIVREVRACPACAAKLAALERDADPAIDSAA